MTRMLWRLLLLSLLAICVPESYAAAKERDDHPVAVPMGPFDLIPLLDVSESYNDNIFYNDLNRKRSMITQIRSGLALVLERKLNRFALNYAFQSGHYHSSPDDDYVDHYVGGQSHIEFTARHRLDLDAKYINAHHPRGTFLSQGVIAEQIDDPDQFHQYSAEAKYRFGAKTAKGNLGLVVGVDDVTYDNHRERTRQFDRTEITLTPEFYYRLFPKTYLLTQIETQLVNYKHNQPEALAGNSVFLDYTKHRYLVGVTSEQSPKTTGRARIGYLQQEFDNNDSGGVNDFTWDVGVQWSPLTYSRFNLDLSKDIYPTLGFGTVRLIEEYQLGWTHDWNRRITTELRAGYASVDHRDSGREDDIFAVHVDVNYGIRRWLSLGLNYTYQNQGSTFTTLDFEQNTIMFYIAGNSLASRHFQYPWRSWY